MSHPYIVHDENGDCLLKTPYNEEFVRKFKDLVDRDSREWDTSAKRWWFDGGYEKLVRALVDRHFGPQRSKPDPAAAASMAYYADPSPRGASGITTEKVYAVVKPPSKAEPTIESLTAEVSRLTYELETERQRRQASEKRAQQVINSSDVLTGELRRERARVAALKRDVSHLRQLHAFSTMGGHFTLDTDDGSAPSPKLSDAYRVLGVLPDLPLEIVEVVWRRLAAKHHPDVGGDPERMKQINSAMDQIRAAKQ